MRESYEKIIYLKKNYVKSKQQLFSQWFYNVLNPQKSLAKHFDE